MKKSNFFWVGFADLMTSLFFIMLVLYVVSFTLFTVKYEELEDTNSKMDSLIVNLENNKKLLLIQAEKAKIIDDVEKNLEPLIKNSSLFKYEEKYKRFTLGFDVKFKLGKSKINSTSLIRSNETIVKISNVGIELQKTIDFLIEKKESNSNMKNVSYLLVISGYSSELINENQYEEYERSYKRAYNLWSYWKNSGVDFEASKYEGLIDLQISGNGWGGVGRFERDPNNSYVNESKNQRFIIQIIPKIGKT
jgi:hypothetical protein